MSVVKGLFSTPKTPAINLPPPQEQPAPPTIDDARAAADAQAESQRRRGRLASVLTPSNTAAQLGGTPQNSLKRMLGA